MNKVFKVSAFTLLIGAITFVSSCNIEDAITDNFTDDLPSSFLGTWVDSNDNEVILKAGNVTYEGTKYTLEVIVLITSSGEEVYSTNTNDEDTNFYFKQPDSTDELQISTVAVSTTQYTTYTKVQ